MRYRNVNGDEVDAWFYSAPNQEALPDWLAPYFRGYSGPYLALEHGPGINNIPPATWIILTDQDDMGLCSEERFSTLYEPV